MKKLLLLSLFFISLCAGAQIERVLPALPSPVRLVNDYTKTLTNQQREALEQKLVAYDDSTSSQIAIVIVNDLGGYEPVEYAVALGRKWGVGGKEFNNGVIILVSKETRDVFIAPGYGLEGAIPDITAKSIVDNALLPNFKQGNFYRGLDEATDDIIKAAAGEYKAPQGYGKRKEKAKGIAGAIIIILIILFVIIGRRGGRGGGGMASRRGYREFDAGWIIGSILSGMSRGGGSGGGGWSGGGGGGFGGFGGGGFGGGGAGGKW
jgi:uncharacterized protein